MEGEKPGPKAHAPQALASIVHYPCEKCGVMQRVPRTKVGDSNKCYKCGHAQAVPKPVPAPVKAPATPAAAVAAPAAPASGAAGEVKVTRRPTALMRHSLVIGVKCTKCGVETHTTHSHVGEKIKCKACGMALLVQAPAPQNPAPPAAPSAPPAPGGEAP